MSEARMTKGTQEERATRLSDALAKALPNLAVPPAVPSAHRSAVLAALEPHREAILSALAVGWSPAKIARMLADHGSDFCDDAIRRGILTIVGDTPKGKKTRLARTARNTAHDARPEGRKTSAPEAKPVAKPAPTPVPTMTTKPFGAAGRKF